MPSSPWLDLSYSAALARPDYHAPSMALVWWEVRAAPDELRSVLAAFLGLFRISIGCSVFSRTQIFADFYDDRLGLGRPR